MLNLSTTQQLNNQITYPSLPPSKHLFIYPKMHLTYPPISHVPTHCFSNQISIYSYNKGIQQSYQHPPIQSSIDCVLIFFKRRRQEFMSIYFVVFPWLIWESPKTSIHVRCVCVCTFDYSFSSSINFLLSQSSLSRRMISEWPALHIYQVKHSVNANLVICLLFHLSYPFICESNACHRSSHRTQLYSPLMLPPFICLHAWVVIWNLEKFYHSWGLRYW